MTGSRLARLEAALRRYVTHSHDEQCEGRVGPSGQPRHAGQFKPSMCFCSQRTYEAGVAALAVQPTEGGE